MGVGMSGDVGWLQVGVVCELRMGWVWNVWVYGAGLVLSRVRYVRGVAGGVAGGGVWGRLGVGAGIACMYVKYVEWWVRRVECGMGVARGRGGVRDGVGWDRRCAGLRGLGKWGGGGGVRW